MLFYGEPVVQEIVCKFPEDKINDHGVFTFPLTLFQSVKAVASSNFIPITIQTFAFLFTWMLVYLIVRLIMYRK